MRDYVQAVIELYVSLPGTPQHGSRGDRRLARSLYERHVPLAVVRAAFVLAIGRRTLRAADAAPLSQIRTLHYFIPVIEEVVEAPIDPGYIEHLVMRIEAQLGRQSKARMDSG